MGTKRRHPLLEDPGRQKTDAGLQKTPVEGREMARDQLHTERFRPKVRGEELRLATIHPTKRGRDLWI